MMTHCSKPGCPQIASVILAYDYAQQTVVLDDATGGDISPHHYPMCLRCTDKLKPPRGWTVDATIAGSRFLYSPRSGRITESPSEPEPSRPLPDRPTRMPATRVGNSSSARVSRDPCRSTGS